MRTDELPTERPAGVDVDPPAPQLVSSTNRVIVGAVLALIGVLWLSERAGWVDLSAAAVLAMATVATGVALMVRSRQGDHPGLIALGLVLASATAVAASAPVEGFQGGAGDRTVEVTDPGELATDYELGAGTLTVDLTAMTWDGELDPIAVNVGMGEVVVLLPDGVAVDVVARAGAGEVDLLGSSTDGFGVREAYRSPGFADAPRRLTIEANVFLGTVEVAER